MSRDDAEEVNDVLLPVQRIVRAGTMGLAMVIGSLWPYALPAQQGMPDDVRQFVEQRTLCDHFREEPWPEGASAEEQERRAFLVRQMERYCTGADDKLRTLRERYRDDREVLQYLNRFESVVETR